MMASGLIVIAHNSAGPLKDIIGPAPKTVGFLCENKEDYSDTIVEILKNYNTMTNSIINHSLDWTNQFSDESFLMKFFSDFDNQLKLLFNL